MFVKNDLGFLFKVSVCAQVIRQRFMKLMRIRVQGQS